MYTHKFTYTHIHSQVEEDIPTVWTAGQCHEMVSSFQRSGDERSRKVLREN